jgi:hypothetical protein
MRDFKPISCPMSFSALQRQQSCCSVRDPLGAGGLSLLAPFAKNFHFIRPAVRWRASPPHRRPEQVPIAGLFHLLVNLPSHSRRGVSVRGE